MIDRFAGLGIVLLAGAFLSTGSSLSAAEKAGTDMTVAASIAVLTRTDGLTLVGRAQALTDADGEARMVVTKKGASGRVSTTQGGDFALSAGDSADVAHVGLSMAPGDQVVVELSLTSGDRVLSTGRLAINE